MILLLLLALPLLALDNVVTLTPASDATNTIQVHQVNFDCGGPGGLPSLPPGKWVAPYVSGTKLTTWQVDQESWCANGSLEKATVSYRYGGNSVQFRADDNPCSAGNRAACDAAGLNQAGMLAFNGGTWTASAVFTANPQGSSSPATFDARARLSAGDWEYILRGPAITQVRAGLIDSSRTNSFGFKQHYIAMLAAQISSSTATSATLNDASQWAGLARPFEVSIGASTDASGFESMLVCFVSGNTIYFGNSNGSDASCANVNGRGASGTVAAVHSANRNGLVMLRDGLISTASFLTSATSLTVSDASAITAVELLQVGTETVRVCNKSGNVLTVGTAAWPCSADANGRNRQGTKGVTGGHSWNVGVPVRILSAVTDRWRNTPSDQFRSLQPDALLSFPAGWAGMNAQFRIQNTWMDRLQSLVYDVNINSGQFTRTGIKHAARQILFYPVYDPATPGLRGLWVGSTPPAVKFDHNLRWCASIGLCPVDPDLPTTLTDISNFIDNGYYSSASGTAPAWTSGQNSKCEADTLTYLESSNRDFYGPQIRFTDGPGSRIDIGLIGKAQALAQKGWGISGAATTTMAEMAGMLSACAGLMPIHHLEHRSGGQFCNGGAYAANTADKACSVGNQSVGIFALFPSVIYEPGINPVDQNNSTLQIIPVGAWDGNNIVASVGGAYSHMANPVFWDSITAGNYFITQLAIGHAGAVAANANAYSISTAGAADQARSAQRGPFGLFYDGDGARQRAWPMRDVLMGALAARSGTPQREYLEWVYRRNIAALEGAYDYQSGSYYIPCQAGASQSVLSDITYSPWCFGRMTRGMNGTIGPIWPSEFTKAYTVTSYANQQRARNVHGSFMQHYENITYGWGSRFLSGTAPFAREFAARMLTRRALSPGGNHWRIGSYQLPNTECTPAGQDVPTCSTQGTTFGMAQGFTSAANWFAAMGTSNSNMTGPEDLNTGAQSRAMMVRSATRLNPRADTPTGTMKRLREAFVFPDPSDLTGDPTWAHALWERPEVSVSAGDTAVKLVASTFWSSCRVAVQSSPFSILDDASHSTATMQGLRLDHVVAGLTAATTYYYMVTCGNLGRSLGTFSTTASAGGATTIAISSKPPAGATNILVDHGATDSLGSSDTGACSGGLCSASIAASTGRAKYYRITYRDAGNATLKQTAIYRRIP